MTAQASDQFEYSGNDYSLAGIKGNALFDPIHYGIKPISSNSACWRGYVCKYLLEEQRLYLKELVVNAREKPVPILKHQPHAIQGFFDFAYRRMRLPIAFTGGLLIGRDFLQDLYIHMGFAPAWKFRDVRELLFEDGKLVRARDRSLQMRQFREEMRDRNLGPENPDSKQSIDEWVKRTFSLNYR